jgi:hypothetical protein
MYEWAQQGKVFVPDQPFQLNLMECSSLLGPYEGYEEKEVL